MGVSLLGWAEIGRADEHHAAGGCARNCGGDGTPVSGGTAGPLMLVPPPNPGLSGAGSAIDRANDGRMVPALNRSLIEPVA